MMMIFDPQGWDLKQFSPMSRKDLNPFVAAILYNKIAVAALDVTGRSLLPATLTIWPFSVTGEPSAGYAIFTRDVCLITWR
jgi:hypothetical protein